MGQHPRLSNIMLLYVAVVVVWIILHPEVLSSAGEKMKEPGTQVQ